MRILLAALVAVFSCPAQAQGICAPYETIKKMLEQTHKERLIFRGIDAAGGVTETWMSVDGGWTMTRTMPDGITCVVNAGKGAIQFEWKLPEIVT